MLSSRYKGFATPPSRENKTWSQKGLSPRLLAADVQINEFFGFLPVTTTSFGHVLIGNTSHQIVGKQVKIGGLLRSVEELFVKENDILNQII